MMSLFSCDMNTELQLMFGKAISFSTSNRYQIHPTKTVASVLSGKVTHHAQVKSVRDPNQLSVGTVYRRKGSYRFKTAFPEPYPLQKRSLFAKNILSRDSDIKSQDKTDESTGADEVKILQDDGDMTDEHGDLQGVQVQNPLAIDPSGVQYQFRANTGQGPVTYRVVQVAAQDGGDPQQQVVTTTGLPTGAQAVVQNPFNSSSPTPDNQPETRFTYFPTVSAVGAGDVDTSHTEVTNALAGQGITTANWQQDANLPQGQFYVMMSPQDVLQGQRNIAPRTGFTPKLEGRSTRDDRRRATHNEVERRRRDKINNWIVQLSKLVPDCTAEQTKGGQLGSKGGILSKACDYINELRGANARMQETMKDSERLSVDIELLRQQCEELKNENMLLRTHMQQHGIVLPDISGNGT